MSEHNWKFTIECPYCASMEQYADEFETDDWFEVFAFSGSSPKSHRNSYQPYNPNWTCRKCNRSIQIDELYRNAKIKTDSIDEIKKYLWKVLYTVITDKGICDHGWEPDLEVAVSRYSLLYPNDSELKQLKQIYAYAVNDPRKLLKFEPIAGTVIIFPEMILCKDVLQKVYLPEGLTAISSDTFSGCKRITDLYLPDSVTEIGACAFKDCINLKTIHLPSKLIKISEGLFQGCRSLEKVFFADTIEVIEDNAFAGCTNMP